MVHIQPVDAPRGGTRIAFLSLLGATLFWAGNYVIGVGAVQSMDPLSLVLLRWAFAAIPLLVIAQLVERPDWRQVIAAWPWLLALSAFGLLGYNLLLYAALQYTDAFSASLINAFNPALIVLAAAVFLQQRLTAPAIGGVLIALAGVLVVLSDGNPAVLFGSGFGRGELLMIGAIVAWTAYTITGRRAPKLPPTASTAVQALVAVAVLTPISFLTGGPTLPGSAASIASLAYIVIFPSILSYLLWNRGLATIPAGRAGVFLNLITVFTAIFAVLSGQQFSAAQVIGGAVVIGGVVLANVQSLRRVRT
ncbi:MAG: EamA family transporter [Glaciihabitans sp.]|nr:EamA family transporter [Glaciihabitans sp.]